MKSIHNQFRRTTAALMALVLVLSVLGPVGIVAAVDGIVVTQQADSTTVNPGDTITFTTDVNVDDAQIDTFSIGLQTDRPDGWTIQRQDGANLGAGPDGWLWFSTTGVSGSDTVQYTVDVPGDADPGDYTVSVTAETEGGQSTTDQTTITVEDPTQNTPPTADAGDDQTVDEGSTVTLDASGSSDSDSGDVLTYTWTQTDSSGESVTLSDATAEQPTFTAPDVDSETTLTFEVEATDGDASDTDTVNVVVQPTNDAPTADAGDDVTVTAGGTIQLDGTGSSDPEGDALSYSWTQTTGPSLGTLSDSDTDTPTLDVVDTVDGGSPISGEFQLTVSDGNGGTDTDTVSVTVEPAPPSNTAPSADAGADQTVDEGATVTLDASGSSDTDGDTLSYAWTQTDSSGESVTLSDATAEQPTFTAPDVDSDTTLTFEVEVSDGTDSDTDTVSVTVEDTDGTQPPVDAPSTTVSLAPTSGEAAVGGTTTYDLVVDTADSGVGAYTATVTVDDPSVATITDVQLLGSPAGQTTNVDIASDGSSVTIDAALMNTADTGSVPVATITVQGETPGSTSLSPSVSALGNEQGTSYDVTGTNGASLTVTEISTSVSLLPTTNEATVGGTTTYDLVVDTADGGVGAYTATVTVDDPSVATITDVQLFGSPAEQTTNVDIASDGSSVTIDAALMNTANTGSVTVATITVEGESAGTTSLSPSISALGTENGNSYAITGTNGASLTVIEVSVGNFPPVTDPDNDGEYEDINGDGNFNIVDIQAMFANLDDSAMQDTENLAKFDFNGDNTVNVVDVQALFVELIS
jgi:hypothetical protein